MPRACGIAATACMHAVYAVSKARVLLRVMAALALIPTESLSGPAPVAAESWVAEYPRVAAAAERDCAGSQLHDCRRDLLRVSELLDGRTDIIYRLAKIEARLDHTDTSLAYLESYARSQLDFGDPVSAPEFRAMRDTRRFRELEQTYRAGLAPRGTHVELATLPTADLIAEDIGVDPRSGSRFLSSVHAGTVLELDATGKWSTFAASADLAAWGIYALAVDPSRNCLWLSTVAGPVSPPYHEADQGRSAILRVGLKSRTVEHKYELADGIAHAFGDLALGKQHEVYVADGVGGGVYRIGPEPGATLLPLVRPGAMRSPQTPVPIPGGARLLVPDYSRGIAVVDLQRDGSVSWLPHPPELALYGIDGLYLHGQTLIAVQNGTVPERLLLLRMDASLTKILHWEVALARTPGLGDPTHGVVRGNRFEFISNSGWDRVDDQGQFKPSPTASNPALWSIALPE